MLAGRFLDLRRPALASPACRGLVRRDGEERDERVLVSREITLTGVSQTFSTLDGALDPVQLGIRLPPLGRTVESAHFLHLAAGHLRDALAQPCGGTPETLDHRPAAPERG